MGSHDGIINKYISKPSIYKTCGESVSIDTEMNSLKEHTLVRTKGINYKKGRRARQ
jgi:hypothetical protein